MVKSRYHEAGKILGIEVSFDGDGYCVKQELAPYEKITEDKLSFTLEE
ncbi:hypothetical protein LOS22_00525 [Enterococcus faecium]|nr:hypothetical protein [Enterococcus faecium]